MSATLKWEPAIRKAHSLPDALKFILRDSCGVSGSESKQMWGREKIPYLTGLVHAKIEGAEELIQAIEKHDEIDLWLEY